MYGNFSRGIVRAINEIIPLSNLRVHFNVPNGSRVGNIYSMVTKEVVPYRWEGQKVVFDIPKLLEYDTFVLEYI